MDIETKLELIQRPPTEEIITEKELRELLETNEHPKHYIGFEISGLLHLGTLIVSGYKINDLAEAGVNVTVYLADWHSFINRKLGGNWDNILKASEYFKEAFNFFCPKAKIVLGSDLYHNNDEYWKDIVRFSSNVTLNRVTRCLTIMGRTEKESLNFAQYIYPPMQAVDIKYLGEDIPHGGMDQRKVHVLAREVFPKLGWKKPIALHHHLLMGLSEPPKVNSKDKIEQVVASKMSKSQPWTAIFIHDSEEQIKEKLLKAWCPERQAEMNPVLELTKYIIFHEKKEFLVERNTKYGGDVVFSSYKELEKEYIEGKLHPMDLKLSVAREISSIIDPIRKHFEKPSNKKLLEVFQYSSISR
ncbi:MAG: tyrosine--tRNA ligase [Thermoproteota archaeon]|nr:tyrosine--tRNA ligase [Candidatus Brockarchaeota archaeon]MBO3762842.1 tyrosine--tRNA ligase [Candidatus Brockarchaeota archaeon]MBO3768403.1 tyrosine--tRNA ligase [Candidatus Brockarchaeota archaeon]MBO3801512.1 tyrosine--tRNA ligase [Candidatus Brockarchaeota archaeon]